PLPQSVIPIYTTVLFSFVAATTVSYTLSLHTLFRSNFGDVLRWTDGNNWYKAYTDGATLYIQKKVAGATSMLATKPFAATAGVTSTNHTPALLSTVTVSITPASDTEHGTAMLTATDD